MALTEYEDLLNDLKKLLNQIKADPTDAHPFVVCLPGTFKAFINIY